MKQRTLLSIRGHKHEWGIESLMSQDQIDAMREDGIEVNTLEYSMPSWVADSGLAHAWCFGEDVFRLRNPFRQ